MFVLTNCYKFDWSVPRLVGVGLRKKWRLVLASRLDLALLFF